MSVGLLVGGIAVPGLLAGLLPRPLAWSGLAIAAIAMICTRTLAFSALSILPPLARFTALAWLVIVGFSPATRPRTQRPPRRDLRNRG